MKINGKSRDVFAILILTVSLAVGMIGCGKPELGKIEVAPAVKEVTVGERILFKAVARSTKGKEMPEVAITWRVDGEAGEIDNSGAFTAKKPGVAVVIAASGGVAGEAKITAKAAPVAKLDLEPEAAEAVVGAVVGFKVTGLTQDGQPAGYNDATVSSPTEGVVFETDKLTLDDKGQSSFQVTVPSRPVEAVVAVASGGAKKEIFITVTPRPVAALEAAAETPRAIAGTELPIEIKAVSADGQPAGFNQVLVSVDTEAATVSMEQLELDPDGKARLTATLAPRPGKNRIIFKSGEVIKTLELEGTKVTRLEITPKDAEYEIGQRIIFQAIGYDDFGNTRRVDARWSLSGDAARLDEGGNLFMQQEGSGILVASYEDVTLGQAFNVAPGKAARLDATPGQVEVKAGDSVSFKADAFNAQGHPLTVEVIWSVEGGIGSVGNDGFFLAKSTGEGSVTATCGDVATTIPIKVTHGPLADIQIRIAQTVLTAGQKIELAAQGLDAYGNGFEIKPKWFLSKALGTINPEEFTFMPLRAGVGEILAKVDDTLKGMKIEVKPAALARLGITPQSVDIVAGETTRFQVEGYDEFGNLIEVKPQFSIRDPLGELDPSGMFKPEKSGNSVVQARADKLVAESTVAVAPAEMVKATLTPEGPVELIAGKSQAFAVSGFDRFGNIVTSEVEWRIFPDLGAIDDKGLLFPQKVGKGRVIADITQPRTGKQLEITADFAISPGDTARVDITPSSHKIVAGEKITFSAAAYDRFGNKTGDAFAWRVEPALGRIEDDGRFDAIKAGVGKVAARHGNVVGAANLEVIPGKAAFLKIFPETISLEAGKSSALNAIAEDRLGNVVVETDILWKLSDETLGKITPDNVLIAQHEGQGHLIAMSNNIADTAPIHVRKGPLHKIVLEPKDQAIPSGSSVQFAAAGFDAGGNPVEADFVWSADEPVGQIDETGNFTALKVGEGKVDVSAGEIKSTAAVMVTPGRPASVSINPEKFTITAGETKTLAYQVVDENGNLVPSPRCSWVVEDDLGAVTVNNVFQAKKAGKGVIRLLAEGVSAQIDVTVEPGEVRFIEISPFQAEMRAGEKQTFVATSYDSEGNPIPLDPKWSVSGKIGTIAVDQKQGKFHATTAGRGFVVVAMNGATGVAEVTVTPGPVASISVEPVQVKLRAGESVQFSATAFDSFGNTVTTAFSWSLAAEKGFGEITPEGVFKAIKTGKGDALASADGVQGKAQITGEPGPLKRILFIPEKLAVKSGEERTIQVAGRDAFGNPLPVAPAFSIQPDTLGAISEKGVLVARGAGFGQLSATVGTLSASAPLTVSPGDLKKLAIKLPAEIIRAGNTYQLEVAGFDAGNNRVPCETRWAVTPNIGQVEKTTGLFHAKKAGKGLLVASSGDIVGMKSITVEPGKLYSLFISPNPVTVNADTIQSFEVSGFDTEENPAPVSESSVDWDVIGGIGFFEQPGVFRGARMGKGKVIARTDTIIAESYVDVLPGKPEFSNGRIRITHPNLPADGKSFSDVIVEVRDKYHNPVPGILVTLVSSRQDDIIVQPPKTDVHGSAQGKISAARPGESILRAVVDGFAFDDTATLYFK